MACCDILFDTTILYHIFACFFSDEPIGKTLVRITIVLHGKGRHIGDLLLFFEKERTIQDISRIGGRNHDKEKRKR